MPLSEYLLSNRFLGMDKIQVKRQAFFGEFNSYLIPTCELLPCSLSMLQALHCFANHIPRTRIIICCGGWASALQVPAVSACLPGLPGIACSFILQILLLSFSKCVSFEAVRA